MVNGACARGSAWVCGLTGGGWGGAAKFTIQNSIWRIWRSSRGLASPDTCLRERFRPDTANREYKEEGTNGMGGGDSVGGVGVLIDS